MRILEEVRKWLGEITEIALLLIALGIAAQILCGDAASFFGSNIPAKKIQNGLVHPRQTNSCEMISVILSSHFFHARQIKS